MRRNEKGKRYVQLPKRKRGKEESKNWWGTGLTIKGFQDRDLQRMLLRVDGVAFMDLLKIGVVRVSGLRGSGKEACLPSRLADTTLFGPEPEIGLVHELLNALKLLNDVSWTLGGVNAEAGRLLRKAFRVEGKLRGRRRHVIVTEGAALSMHGIRTRRTDKRLAALKWHHAERTKRHDLVVAPRAAGTKGRRRALEELHDLVMVVFPDFDREMANTAGHDKTRATRRLEGVALTVVCIAKRKASTKRVGVDGGRRDKGRHRSTRHGDR